MIVETLVLYSETGSCRRRGEVSSEEPSAVYLTMVHIQMSVLSQNCLLEETQELSARINEDC